MAKVKVEDASSYLGISSSSMVILSADDGIHYLVDDSEELHYALSLSETDAKDSIIHIAQGTYEGDFSYYGGGILDYIDEGLTLLGGYDATFTSRSTDPSLTIFDGKNAPSSITINASYNTSDILIDGFAFQNNIFSGFDMVGGSLAIMTKSGIITVNNNIFQDNTIDSAGGAVAIMSSNSYPNNEQSVVFTNNTLTDNGQIHSSNAGIFGDGGGALLVKRSKDVLIEDNTFEGNTAGGDGGALWAREVQNIVIKDNTFEDNTSSANGGALYAYANRGSVTLEGNTIINNDAYSSGGAHLLSTDGDIYVIANTISDNTASSAHGAISSATSSGAAYEQIYSGNIIEDNSSHRGSGAISVGASSDNKIQINNNLIADNSLNFPSEVYDNYGGGLKISYGFGGDLELTNNTIVNNHADGTGGGVDIHNRRSGAEWDISNNVFYGNTNSGTEGGGTKLGSDISINADLEDFTLNLESNIFDPNLLGFGVHSGSNVHSYEIPSSNIDSTAINPLFVDAANGDYRLSSDSPLIDQGVVTANVASADLDGNTRTVGSAIDIGAYEYQSVVVPTAPVSPIITGTTGDDTLIVNTDTTSVQANTGTDIAVFSGNYTDYTFSQSDSYVSLLTNTSTNQVVSLFDVERLQFDNTLYELLTNNNGEYILSTGTNVNHGDIEIAKLDNGNLILSWYSFNGELWGIYAQQYDSNLELVGSEIQIVLGSISQEPEIAPLQGGGFVISWRAHLDGIKAQRFDSDNNPLGGQIQITNGDALSSSVTSIENGEFVASWTATNNEDGSGWGVFGQRYDGASGSKLGAEFQVNTYSDNMQTDSSVALLSNGKFVITWYSENQDGSNNGIYAQMYNNDGTKQGGEFIVNSYTDNNQYTPEIESLKDGGFIISWSSLGQDGGAKNIDSGVIPMSPLSMGVYAQRFDSNGVAVGGEFQVNTHVISDQYGEDIEILKSGNFVVTWHSGDGYRDNVIRAQLFDSDGNNIGDEFQVNTTNDGYSSSSGSKIVSLDDGGFLVTWRASGQDFNTHIYAQRYDSEANPLGVSTLNKMAAVIGTAAADILEGTADIDYILTYESADVVYALAGNDTISLAADGVYGNGYLAMNVGNDSSVGTNETIKLNGYNRFSDVIDGGDNIDTLNLTTGNDAFFIDDVYSAHHSSLTLTSTTQGIDSIARITNLEVINAGEGNDIVDLTSSNFSMANAVEINGEAGDDTLWGSIGNDTINGGTGDDSIFGGIGDDMLTGGTGSDTFQFTASAGSDTITDFDVNNDFIELYYRAEDNHLDYYPNLYFVNETLTWNYGADGGSVSIHINDVTFPSGSNDYYSLITFVEIV